MNSSYMTTPANSASWAFVSIANAGARKSLSDQFTPADVRAISTNAELRNGAKRKD